MFPGDYVLFFSGQGVLSFEKDAQLVSLTATNATIRVTTPRKEGWQSCVVSCVEFA